jgi:hypothetical protein
MIWRPSSSVAFRRVAHRFDVVSIGVDDEGPIVVRVILRAQPRLSFARAASSKGCTVEQTHRLTRWRSKRDVKARRWTHAPLRSGVLEPDVEGEAFDGIVLTWGAVSHLARNLKMRNKPKRSERGVVEELGAPQVVDANRHVVKRGVGPMFGHDVFTSR